MGTHITLVATTTQGHRNTARIYAHTITDDQRLDMTRPRQPKNEISGPNSQIAATIAGQRASWTWSWTSAHKLGLGFRNELDATFQGLYHFGYGVTPSYTEPAIGFQLGFGLGNRLEALAGPMEICPFYGVTPPRAPSCTTSNLLFSPDAMDLDVGMVHSEDISASDDKPMPPILHDQYCFICGNGGDLMMCNTCSRSICIGSDTQCLDLPATSRYQDEDVSFICPACHQDMDRKINKPTPYFDHQTKGRDPEPIYQHPAEIRGSAQVIPRSKYQNDGVAILNFRLKSFNCDTGDLGKILGPFAAAFFPNQGGHSLLFENIDFDLTRGRREHRQIIERVQENLRAATGPSSHWHLLSPTLKTVIVLITTHAEDNTGELGTSSTNHANINDWMTQVITRPILDMIHALNTHWFFLCCGALVNVPTSLDGVRSFANEWKPANLFAFDAPAFHPIYAATFLLNFFQHNVIEGRSFDSAVGLLLNTSALSRHTGIKRFWSRGEVVKECCLRWTHLRTQPWGNAVPHQCQDCGCIQSWNQKVKGPSTELPRDDVSMRSVQLSRHIRSIWPYNCVKFSTVAAQNTGAFPALVARIRVCALRVVAAVSIVARLPVMHNTSQRIGLFATIVPKNAFTIFPINAHKAETDHKKLIDANAAAEGRGVAELITRFEGRKYSLRLPRASQLLRRLGPEWPPPGEGEGEPTAAQQHSKRWRPASHRTGLAVDVTAVAPWEIPIWAARLSHMGVMSLHRRKAWTKDLTLLPRGNEHRGGPRRQQLLTNEGREDDKAVGGAAAVMSLGTRWGEPAESWDWTHGKMAKQFDVACFGLAKTVEALTIRFAAEATPPDTIFVLCSDASALLAVKNTRNKTAQSSALLFHFSLTTLCTIHRNTNIVLVWTPTDHELENQTVARHKATEACRRDPPGRVERVQSAAYQKDRARQKAFQEWAAEWKKRQGEIRAGQRTASFADKVTLTKPPDGNNHPLWSAATECERDAKGKKTKKALFSRRTTSTAFQISVDHAFTGSYAARFRPADPPESLRHAASHSAPAPTRYTTASATTSRGTPLVSSDTGAPSHTTNSYPPIRKTHSVS
ncbi:hypothetical protein EDB85DRAFT_2201432 [Lactarius pseudohatsudake]|nr:hypothetical protein EDB85DRAFT_2201432 [Lactarius pseudohatsudake]